MSRWSELPEPLREAMDAIRGAIEETQYILDHDVETMDNDAQFEIEQMLVTLEAEYMEVENSLQGIT